MSVDGRFTECMKLFRNYSDYSNYSTPAAIDLPILYTINRYIDRSILSYRPQNVTWTEEQPFAIRRKHCPLRAELTCQNVGEYQWLVTIVGGATLAVHAQLKTVPIARIATLRGEIQRWLRYSCIENALRFTGFRETTVEYIGDTPCRMSSTGIFHPDE